MQNERRHKGRSDRGRRRRHLHHMNQQSQETEHQTRLRLADDEEPHAPSSSGSMLDRHRLRRQAPAERPVTRGQQEGALNTVEPSFNGFLLARMKQKQKQKQTGATRQSSSDLDATNSSRRERRKDKKFQLDAVANDPRPTNFAWKRRPHRKHRRKTVEQDEEQPSITHVQEEQRGNVEENRGALRRQDMDLADETVPGAVRVRGISARDDVSETSSRPNYSDRWGEYARGFLEEQEQRSRVPSARDEPNILAELVGDPIEADAVDPDQLGALEQENRALKRSNRKRIKYVGAALITVGALAGTVGGLIGSRSENGKDDLFPSATPSISLRPTDIPSGSPTSAPSLSPSTSPPSVTPSATPTSVADRYVDLILEESPSTSFANSSSPQSLALGWITTDPYTLNLTADFRIVQRFAFATMWYANGGPTADENWATVSCNERWMKASHECFYGCGNSVSCTSTGEVEWLRLVPSNNDGPALDGTIPEEIGLLTELTYLNMLDNRLWGTIPTEFGLLTELTYLELGSNGLEGTIPTTLGLLTKLTSLSLERNSLSGQIPAEIAHENLEWVDLENNNLSGVVPPAFCERAISIRVDCDVVDCPCNASC